MPRPTNLSSQDIASTFAEAATAAAFPPVLTIKQAAALLQVSIRTMRHWVSAGYFSGATSLIGKHRRFWRDRLLTIAFSRERTRARYELPSSHPFTGSSR